MDCRPIVIDIKGILFLYFIAVENNDVNINLLRWELLKEPIFQGLQSTVGETKCGYVVSKDFKSFLRPPFNDSFFET